MNDTTDDFCVPDDSADPTNTTWGQQFRNDSRLWIQRVLVPLIVTVGVLGNLVTIVVLTRRRMRSSTNVYLTALAVSDLLYLVFVLALSFQHYPNIHNEEYYFYWHYMKYGYWLADATSYTSIWLTVSFTLERYIAVCHPMKGQVLCTESRARKVVILVYVLCFLSVISTPFEWEFCEVERNGTTKFGLTDTLLGLNKTYRTIFYWFSSSIFVFLPLILLGIFNSILIHVVHKSQRQRCRMTQTEQSDSAQTQENKITITLISVVVLFMVCQMPSAMMLIYLSFHKVAENSEEDFIQRALGNIFNFLNAVNAACNFILYCAFSDKYRRTFLVTFLGRCYNLPSHYSQSFYSSRINSTHKSSSVRQTSVRTTTSVNVPNSKRSTVRRENKQQSSAGVKQNVNNTANNLHVPLFQSLRFQFLLHNLPIPHKLEQQNGTATLTKISPPEQESVCFLAK